MKIDPTQLFPDEKLEVIERLCQYDWWEPYEAQDILNQIRFLCSNGYFERRMTAGLSKIHLERAIKECGYRDRLYLTEKDNGEE